MLCPVCQTQDLVSFFDGGDVPLFVNVLHEDRASAVGAPKGRIELGGCHACGFIHNVAFNPKLVEYVPGYENSLHGSPTFQDWATSLAAGLVERHSLAGARAVEIGGGRGEFMELLVGAGLSHGLVMDPSAPEDAITPKDAANGGPAAAPAMAAARAFELERRLFEPSDAQSGLAPTRLLLTRHVLEHLADPFAFASLLAGSAKEAEAGLYLEVPNGLWTVRDLGIWDLIYEHCSYFTPRALHTLLLRAGADARIEETYGDQFLSAEAASVGAAARAAAAPRPSPSATEDGLRAAFGAAREATVSAWNHTLAGWAQAGKRAAIWGAGSKGATFLNTVDGPDVITCAIDVNDRKVGRFVAGTGHPIVGHESIKEERLDAIIVMNPRYMAEIESMARASGSDAEVLSIVQ